MPVYILSEKIAFPPPHLAQKDGLLAIGGDLSAKRLLLAYRMGIFPWFSHNDPLLWWSPDPRLVLYPRRLAISKSLKKILKKRRFHVTLDQAFEQVISQCAQIRIEKDEPTWIHEEMIRAYIRLHHLGYAHSVEVWDRNRLAGGLYGVSLGKAFFGESMFSRVDNASKVGLIFLVKHLQALSFDMIDCQVTTDHMIRMGATEVPRDRFLAELEKTLQAKTRQSKWHFNGSDEPVCRDFPV